MVRLAYRGGWITVEDCGFPLVRMPRELVLHWGGSTAEPLVDGLNFHECARHLGLSISRVYQLHHAGQLAERMRQ